MDLNDHIDDVTKLVSDALKDTHLMVLGPAISLGSSLLPRKFFLNLLHPVYYKICDNLHKFESLLLSPICLVLA
jgi:hypothetical protein